MNLEDFKVGVLFRWTNYNFQHDNVVKDRYFIFLGKTNEFLTCNIDYHVITGTSQIHYYQTGELRAKAHFLRFAVNEHSLPLETIFDVDLNLESHHITTFRDACNEQMSIVSQLSDEELRVLFDKIAESDRISLQVKTDIRNAFDQSGIKNLPALRRRDTKYKFH